MEPVRPTPEHRTSCIAGPAAGLDLSTDPDNGPSQKALLTAGGVPVAHF